MLILSNSLQKSPYPPKGFFVLDRILIDTYTKSMNKLKNLEKKIEAICEYLEIDLEYTEGYTIKNKQEMGFNEKKKRI